MNYVIYLEDSGEFRDFSGRGVFRIGLQDSVVFCKRVPSPGLALRDILGDVVAELEFSRNPSALTCWGTTRAWTPSVPGPYSFSFKEADDDQKGKKSLSSFFSPGSTIVVAPSVARSSLRMLSIMPRRLGYLSDWESALGKAAVQQGYNSVHLTPFQPSGPSGSAYSIADVLDVDKGLFAPSEGVVDQPDRVALFSNVIDSVRQNLFMVTDVVLNHASSCGDSWVLSQPDATFCLTSCPYLQGAWELDELLAEFSVSFGDRFKCMRSEEELGACMLELRRALEKFRLKDFFQIDFQASVGVWLAQRDEVASARELAAGRNPYDQAVRQVGTSRDTDIVVDCFGFCADEASLWRELHSINQRLDVLASVSFHDILAACESTLRHERVSNGRSEGPLFPRYFSQLKNGDWALNNGWVMNWPAGVDFASPGPHLVYLRRHVVVWGDCLKLRYDDEGMVWAVMEEYVRFIASRFDGIRLDNCHSTPIHVLRRLLSVMRKVNPNILVMAELFTGEANNDNVYEATLGLDLLVREAMQIYSVDDLVGKAWEVANRSVGAIGRIEKKFEHSHNHHHLLPTKSSSIIYDSTHDNSTVHAKFGSFTDALPLAAVVAVSPASTGSSAGFDSLSVRMPSVVQSICKFREDDFPANARTVGDENNIIWLTGHADEEVVVFGDWDDWKQGKAMARDCANDRWILEKVELGEEKGKVLLAQKRQQVEFKFYLRKARVWVTNPVVGVAGVLRNNVMDTPGTFWGAKQLLNRLHAQLDEKGFSAFFAKKRGPNLIEVCRVVPDTLEAVVVLARFAGLEKNNDVGFPVEIEFENFFSHVESAFSLEQEPCVRSSGILTHYCGSVRFWSKAELGFELLGPRKISLAFVPPSGIVVMRSKPCGFPPRFSHAPADELETPSQFSQLLFRCDVEEPCYDIPGFGKLVFAGLAGVAFLIEDLTRGTGDPDEKFLASALAETIRRGDWLFDYIAAGIKKQGLTKMWTWLVEKVRPVYSTTASGLKPALFVDIFYRNLFKHVMTRWDHKFAKSKESPAHFEKRLLFASFQFTAQPTIAAGLPFFAAGFMRCWGRDTFIALPGLLLASKRFADARRVFLEFAQVVRHGLIPNLFDEGRNPRYNSRDACWCFLRSLVEYLKSTGDESILEENVPLKYFKAAFSWSGISSNPPTSLPLLEVVLGILKSHYDGIDFIEWNAGPAIDEHMTPLGFHIQAFVEKSTGIVYGGNEWNCGTWMDKMGSGNSNRGVPATSRHGAAVEINGLAVYVLDFFVPKYCKNEKWLNDWLRTIRASFDKVFFNPEKGLFKDVVGGDVLRESQLRPNACFALAVTPLESIDPLHAKAYLELCEESLLGPLGMRTLCAADPMYNGYYDNNDDSRGFNYHNGPEWVWLLGYYVIACTRFNIFPKTELIDVLRQHETHIQTDPYRSLPELTNMNGAFCPYSCPSQAWSVATIIEALQCLE